MALPLPVVMKTTAARLSALFLVLFSLCAIVLVYYMSSLSTRMLIDQTQETIAAEAQVLGRAYQRGGLPLLVRFVDTRSRQPGAYLYLVAEPNGRILSGNVESLEPGVLETDGWTQRPFAYTRFGDGGESARRAAAESGSPESGSENAVQAAHEVHHAVALVLRLPNQMILLVGRDLGEPEQLHAVVRRSLTVAFGMMGVGALLIWLLVGRSALRRIDKISDASRRIMGGDLSGRLPVSGVGDEFDRLSTNLNVMLERIAVLNEGLKQVSDNIAHDLKTPLTRMRNRAEAALAGNPTAEGYRAAIEATIAESDTLIRTFNAILMISRLEAGYSAEQTETVDLSAIARDVIELYEPVAEEMGVGLDAALAEGVAVTGNRELIAQSLSNVVDNAIKYSAGSVEAPRVTVSLRSVDAEIVLDIDDNGPGIPEADRERATERFVRLERSRSQPGSGLGLSLAKAVMKFHGGRLELIGRKPGLSVRMIFPGGFASR